MTVAVDATIDDQRRDLYSLELDHWWQMVWLLPNLRSGTHSSMSFVRSLSGQDIDVTTRRHPAINTDLEMTTTTPDRFRVIPKAISVLVPS